MNSKTAFKFCLYVASDTPNAAKAEENLKQFCREHLAGRHVIEVVDVFKDPKRALVDQVYLTPLLVRIAPPPERRIVGNLSDRPSLLVAVGLGNDVGGNAA